MRETTVRTDVHRPSAEEFDPEKYEFLDVYDFKPSDGFEGGSDFYERKAHLELIEEYRAKGYRFASHVGREHKCGHCGAWLRYAALMAREDVHELIYIGETCLSGRFEYTKAQFQQLRKQAELDRAKQARLAVFDQFLADHPELTPATYAYNFTFEDGEFQHEKYNTGWALSVIEDILSKLRQYGSISEKQIAFVVKLAAEVEEKVTNYIEPEPNGPAPRGKATVEGVIIGLKVVDGYAYGTSTVKMTVKLDNGSRVYGTLPSALSDADKGYRVKFSASFEAPQDGAEDFAFFRRPTKPEIVSTSPGCLA